MSHRVTPEIWVYDYGRLRKVPKSLADKRGYEPYIDPWGRHNSPSWDANCVHCMGETTECISCGRIYPDIGHSYVCSHFCFTMLGPDRQAAYRAECQQFLNKQPSHGVTRKDNNNGYGHNGA